PTSLSRSSGEGKRARIERKRWVGIEVTTTSRASSARWFCWSRASMLRRRWRSSSTRCSSSAFFAEQQALYLLIRNLLLQHLGNVLQGEAQLFEGQDAVQTRQLPGAVGAIARVRVDEGGCEQPDFIIVLQQPLGHPRQLRKFPGEKHAHPPKSSE